MLRRLEQQIQAMDQRIDARLGSLETRMERLEKRFEHFVFGEHADSHMLTRWRLARLEKRLDLPEP